MEIAMTLTDEELAAARRERARRQQFARELALADDAETEETLTAALAAAPLLRIRNGDLRCVIALRAG
jgi:hypothetical protein